MSLFFRPPRGQRSLKVQVAQLRLLVVPWLPVFLLFAIVIVPLGLFIWLFFFTDIFVVQAVTVVDAREHITEAAKERIAAHVDKTPFGHNIFFVQTEAIEDDIAAAIPEVRNVHVARKLPGTIKAIIQEKSAALLFLSNGQYYFVDDEGIAYEKARLETLPGEVLPVVKNSDQGGHATVGVPVVAPLFVNFIQYMQEHLPKRIGTQVAEIRIPSLSAREVHFLLVNNWEIRFDSTRDPARQLDILRQLLEGTITLEEQQQLEYVDLRIPDRVYYQTRDAAAVAPKAAD